MWCLIVGLVRELFFIPVTNVLASAGLEPVAIYLMDWINALYFSILVC